MQAEKEPRPDLAAVPLQCKNSDDLWKLLTDPATPYLQRRAAAVQGAKSFPLERLPQLAAALSELRQERERSNFGLKHHPLDSRPLRFGPPAGPAPPSLLGKPWTCPARETDYPLGWAEEARAPWPWQAEQALSSLQGQLFPHDPKAAELWLRACLGLPCNTDREAQMFVAFCQGSSHWKSPEIYERLHRIAMNPALPTAAGDAARVLTDSVRLWDDPRAQPLAISASLDILRHSPHQEARHTVAYGLRNLTLRWRPDGEVDLPRPTVCIQECLKMSQDPRQGDEWTRLYVYGFSALEAMARPPFAPDRRMDPRSPEVGRQLRRLGEWFREHPDL